ncbi:MAG: amidohydrolase family protein [Pseudomonadota bacterium]
MNMGFASPEQVEAFMGDHPNLYMVISKKDRLMEDFSDSEKQASIGSAFLKGFRLRPEWKAILIQYQDRFLFGTDPHMKKLWEHYPMTIKSYRLVLGQLPHETAEKIACKNAEKLYKIHFQ